MDTTARLLTTDEAAAYLAVSRCTVHAAPCTVHRQRRQHRGCLFARGASRLDYGVQAERDDQFILRTLRRVRAPGAYVSAPSVVSALAHDTQPMPRGFASCLVNVRGWVEHENGGHFAAWEQPRPTWRTFAKPKHSGVLVGPESPRATSYARWSGLASGVDGFAPTAEMPDSGRRGEWRDEHRNNAATAVCRYGLAR